MAHGDTREGKWRGNWRMEWVSSTLHTTSEHGVSSITTADAHTSAARSRLNWRPRRFKWTRPFRRKTKSGFCPDAITFQLADTSVLDTTNNVWPLKMGPIVCSETAGCVMTQKNAFLSLECVCCGADVCHLQCPRRRKGKSLPKFYACKSSFSEA